MRKVLYAVIAIFFIITLATIVGFNLKKDEPSKNNIQYSDSLVQLARSSAFAYNKQISEAKLFVNKNNYNKQFCFFVDMSLPSGSPRFFIFDLKKDSIVNAGLVAHGNCNQYWLEGRKYGNVIGCGCTSLGKYRIGKSYYGKFGLAYKLYGLDSTNNNAFSRYIVLHSHSCVPEIERQDDICQSNGCPTVNPSFLKILQAKVDVSGQSVLLWIFD